MHGKFRRRGWTSFFAFLSAVLSAVFGMIGMGTAHKCAWPDYVGVILLAISAALMIANAFIEILEI